jgi:hypothetical protein
MEQIISRLGQHEALLTGDTVADAAWWAEANRLLAEAREIDAALPAGEPSMRIERAMRSMAWRGNWEPWSGLLGSREGGLTI